MLFFDSGIDHEELGVGGGNLFIYAHSTQEAFNFFITIARVVDRAEDTRMRTIPFKNISRDTASIIIRTSSTPCSFGL